MEALKQTWNEVSQKLYQQEHAAGGAEGEQPSAEAEADTGKEEKDAKDVEEADYEVVDDEKK